MNQPYSNFADPKLRPDLRKRAAMLDFLRNHDRHADHYQPFQFSNCIKLHSLDIPRDQREAAYTVLELENESGTDPSYGLLFAGFEAEQGAPVDFAGRSGGHIALDEPYANLSPAELRELPISELRALARLVLAFDALCDSAVTVFQDKVENYHVESVEVTTTHAVRILVENEE